MNAHLSCVELFNNQIEIQLIEMLSCCILIITFLCGFHCVSGQNLTNLVTPQHRQTHELRVECPGYPKLIKPCWEVFRSEGKYAYNIYFADVEDGGDPVLNGWHSVTISNINMDPEHRLMTEVYVSPTKLTVYETRKPGEPTLDLTTSPSFVTLCDTADTCMPCTLSSVWNPYLGRCICLSNMVEGVDMFVKAQAHVDPYDVVEVSRTECVLCMGYKQGVQGVCTCMDDFLTEVDSDQQLVCLCDAGKTPFVDTSSGVATCVKCGAYSNKSDVGNSDCETCPPGEHGSENGRECMCPGVRVTARGRDLQCVVCTPGTFELSDGTETWNGTCGICPMGYVSQTTSASFCIPCTNGTFSNTDRTECQCPGNKKYDEDSMTCVCKPEYFPIEAGMCELCPVGTFKAVLGNDNCTQCPIGSTNWPNGTRTGWICDLGQRASGDTCIQCPRDSMSRPVDVRTYCICGEGMFLSGDACIPCSVGTYKGWEGDQACLACDVGQTTLSNGTVSNDTGVCVCAAGYFINDTLGCEECPENTYNPFNLATGAESCMPCTFRVFQPSKGRAECVPQNVDFWSMVVYDSDIVGLFVSEDMSCVYINKRAGSGIDRVCWGGLTGMNLTRDVFHGVAPVCGDAMLHPLLEECDDGNVFGGDGCSSYCLVEPDFFCPSAEVIIDIPESLSGYPSTCCRLGGVLSKTSMCTHCHDRELPFPGVRYRESDCELEDIDECVEGLDGCVLQTGGVSCVNLDALASGGVLRFECVCPPGLFVSDQGCIAERFRTQFVLEVNHTEYPDAVRLVKKITIQLYATRNLLIEEMLIEEGERLENVGIIRVTLLAGSWAEMQNMTLQLNTTRLVELMQALPRDADGIQARFGFVDVARYGFNSDDVRPSDGIGGMAVDRSGNNHNMQHVLPTLASPLSEVEYNSLGHIPEGDGNVVYISAYRREMLPESCFSYVEFTKGSFSSQLRVSVWVKPIHFYSYSRHPTHPPISGKQIFFSLEADAMKGYLYVYAWKGQLHLRARAEGYSECISTPLGYDTFEELWPHYGDFETDTSDAVGVPYADFTENTSLPKLSSAQILARHLRFIEVSSELEDPDAAVAGATAGLSTIRVSVDGIPTLSVTGCMLDSTLYTKLQVMAATTVQNGSWMGGCTFDDLWIRNAVNLDESL
jgi:cysteine-rich repeat protein